MKTVEVPTLDLEQSIADQGADVIVGFDEVGRGALAGPVMVGAAAIWSRDAYDLQVPVGVADSKLLSERKREAMLDEVESWCAAYAVGQASNTEIDEWGISHALGIAALRALRDVELQLGMGASAHAGDTTRNGEGASRWQIGAILDGPHDYITKALDTFDAPDVPVAAKVVTKIKGDRSCVTVAVASVIAKVTRDRLMVDIARGNARYAPYAWEHNKGYGSAAHRQAIAQFGPTPLHRMSWHLV
ncbi:ribonuclease HII [Bifidobacterium tsurumiense]|uniref:ribonuclease HII n=1 Tax=Bifidobacterium tsurumiense TaxID=356829 RepID=UPI0012B39A46|nr:ribonuclease HII [Bifidobacterium tsurumiense]MDY4677524.1 ribonuclease HII [Bifidobacterium tsurumiense]MSS13277.1 ribonuclease HII [Bifidobacterium tsurumiense]